MQNERKKFLQLVSLKVVFMIFLFVIAVLVFALIANETLFEHEEIFDARVSRFFEPLSTDAVIKFMRTYTFFGSGQFLFPTYVALVGYFFTRRKFIYGINIAIIGLTATALSNIFKQFFHRQRPAMPLVEGITDYSFPSGHALSFFVFCSVLILLIQNGKWEAFNKWLVSVLLFLLAVLMGISRIILKVHYPTDVIASFCLGTAWVILSFWLLTLVDKKMRSKSFL